MAVDQADNPKDPADEWLALDPVERDILSYLSERGTTTSNLCARLGIPYHRIYYHLVKLMTLGLVRRSKLGHEKKCYINSKGRELVSASITNFSSVNQVQGGTIFYLKNRQVCFCLVSEVGGRILEIKPDEKLFGLQESSNILHTLYPSRRDFGKYTEFGGIEEQIHWKRNSFPGSGWDQAWSAHILSKRNPASIMLETQIRNPMRLDLRKVYTLDIQEPMMKVERSFRSCSEKFLMFSWTNHPELRKDLFDSYSAPGERGILTERLAQAGRQNRLQCNGVWWLVYHSISGLYIGEVFPEGVLDHVSVYNPKVGDHYVLVPGVHGRLVPGQVASFESYIVLGKGGPESFMNLVDRLKPKCDRDAEWAEKGNDG